MDNELYTIDHNKQICETCDSWKQFNHTAGLCDEVNSYLGESMYNQTCDYWKNKFK